MRKLYIIFCISCICTFYSSAVAQTIWTGSKTTFTKADGADWTQAANQDRITTNVWITRANSQGIFNIVLESGFDNTNRDSPKDTEWAFGIASNYESLTFNNWATTINNLPLSNMLNQNMVLHLITDNIYIDIKFTSWSSGGSGGSGGISYERSTDHTLSNDDFTLNESIKLHPNPSYSFIKVLNINPTETYKIYNILGVQLTQGSLKQSNQIDIQNLKSGIYILQLNSGKALRFVKK